MDKDTQQILDEIGETDDIAALLAQNEDEMLDMSAWQFLNGKLTEKNKTVAEVIRNTTQGPYLYKVFNGEREPSRNTLITIAFGLGLDFKETQMLLRLSGTERLDPRVKRDAVAIHGIMKGLKIDSVNDILAEIGEYPY